MFKKLLKSIGIGAATVDTQLSKRNYVAGEVIEGVTYIKGGSGSQTIDSIYLKLMTEYEAEVGDEEYRAEAEIGRIQLHEPFEIGEGEERAIPFQMAIPLHTPVTMGKTSVWIQTGLDIKKALDPTDRDLIEVAPHPMVGAFLEAAAQLGFQLRQVECEEAPLYDDYPNKFVQEFEFRAIGGEFAGKLDELEAIFTLTEEWVRVDLEVDRRARNLGGLLAESLGMDESKVRVNYTPADLANLPQIIADAIRPCC